MITPIKTSLALILSIVAVIGSWILKNPDGDHFFGRIRDDIRVERVTVQIARLSDVYRSRRLDSTPAPTPSNPTLAVSPWGTIIEVQSKDTYFSIKVPVSSYGCYRLLLKMGKANLVSASANEVRMILPISSISEIKGCTSNSINILTFLFKYP
jgi:hypothetical protein